MTRVASILFFLTAAGAAMFLFHIKQEVREMEEELGIVRSNILRHQEAIQVLRTEWSYLNRPARIAELAERYLDIQQLAAPQFVGFEDIPYRSADTAQTPVQLATQSAPTLAAAALAAATQNVSAVGTAR